ncbi:MAG: ABC transporter ATP-binding protein [Litorimonas sp.]
MSLVFDDIHHNYGSAAALRGITLDARPGEIVCLLGQSGCGKSTLLNLAAGILPVQSGTIRLDGEVLASKAHAPPPERRPVGLVFQEGALFPHLTVAQNIGFGVADAGERGRIVSDLLEQIGLEDYGGRYPHTLSGGQRQRIAVARALAPAPRVLLMDEPFANIDILLRKRLREEMRRLLKARGCVTILVTHDPEEAIETADRIAVMEAGQIVQQGTADALYRDPASLMVGLLTGEGSIVRGQVRAGAVETAFGTLPTDRLSGVSGDGAHDVLIRPGMADVEVAPIGPMVTDIRHTGERRLVTLEAAQGEILLLSVGPGTGLQVGQRGRIVPVGRFPSFPVEG